jgi:hypothetical protein
MRTHAEVNRMVAESGVPKAASACMVAAVLFTYRCTIACRHCCFGCATDRPDRVMTARQCVDALALLHETGRVIHIAGGEAMLYWNVLADALQLAAKEGLAPHFIETNCSFAVSDELTRERLLFMRRHGVQGLLASADPYHQEFVPAERFLRVRRLAIEIFGAHNFYGPGHDDEEIRAFEGLALDEARLRDFVRRHPPLTVGTAQKSLADCLDRYPVDDPRLPWRGWREPYVRGACATQFQAGTLWELHIDPYGNIQTNCGMILGNVPKTTPAALLASGPEKANRFVRTVSECGPLGLARLAEKEYGFVIPSCVAQNCELCYLTRTFLRAHHPEVFGPAEIYIHSSDPSRSA